MQSSRLKEFVYTVDLRPLLGSSVAAAAATGAAGGAAAGDATVHAAGGAVGLLRRVEAVDLRPAHASVVSALDINQPEQGTKQEMSGVLPCR